MIALGRWLAIASVMAVPGRLPAQCPDGSPPPCGPRSGPSPASVAVLYFANLSRDSNDVYLADGLTEDIITRLGRVERLTVKSRNAVWRYRGVDPPDPAVLGRSLDVAHLVSGSVRRSPSGLRVTVELVRASTGVHVWGEQYDRRDADLLALESDVSEAVAAAIAGKLLPAERSALGARPTRNNLAYDHFLRGNRFLAQRSADGFARAIAEYEAATGLDSTFAEAPARVALSYGLLLYWGAGYAGLSADMLLARGNAAVERALQLRPSSSDAWMAKGLLLGFAHPLTYEGVRETFERAIALDPRNAEAHSQYAVRLLESGMDSAGIAELQRALAIDPLRSITLQILGRLAMDARRYPEAIEWFDSALVVDPGFVPSYVLRARVRLLQGEVAQGRRDAERAVAASQAEPLLGESALAMVEAREGDTTAARARMERLLGQRRGSTRLGYVEGSYLAAAMASVGMSEQALTVLEQLQPGRRLWDLTRFPEFDAIRTTPRFQRLTEASRPQ